MRSNFNGVSKYTEEIMAFYACPTIPMVEYRLKIAMNDTAQYFCLVVNFVEVL
jgi:hypothetical protein